MIYLQLFLEFLKIGLFTFGGGYAMIPLIQETVLAHDWIDPQKFYEFIGICESTPGPVAINFATYIGSTNGGVLGAICATLGVITPSIVIILIITSILNKFKNNKIIKYIVYGFNGVSLGLILSTGIIMALNLIGLSSESFSLVHLLVLSLIAIIYFVYKIIMKKKLSNLALIVISGVLGVIVSCIVL